MGSKMILRWALIGAFIGFFVIHPSVMLIGHFMMEPRLFHDHSIFEMVTSEIPMSFSVKMMPWSLTFASFGALIGFFQGRGRQARKALQISEERYRTLIDSSLTGVFIHQDEKYVFFNDRFAQIHGYKPEELMGRKYLELIHPDEREAVVEIVSKRLEGEPAPEEYEIRRFRKDKKAIWCQVMATTIEYKGSPAILGNIIDISDRKLVEETLKESEDRSRSISTSAKDAIVMMDNNGNVSYWNPAAEKMFGHTIKEAIGNKLHILLAPERYHEAYREGFSAFKETGKGAAVGKTLELEGVRKDGKEFLVELSMNSLQIKGQWHAVGIMRDITRRKQAEEDLKRTHDQLEEANKKLGFAYTQMRDWRDRLGTQLHGEEIGFLIDEKGQILGVTEKAMESTGQSRIKLLGGNISDLVDEEGKYEVKDNIKKAWGGVFRKSFFNVIRKGSSPQKFETKFIRINPEHGRMLLVLMRESYEDDQAGNVD